MARAGKIAGGIVLGLLILIGIGFGLLQTGPGKDWLAGTLSRLLSSPKAHVVVEGLTGTVPFDIAVREIRFTDPAGTWLTLNEGAMAIAPGDLPQGRLTFRNLSAQEIDVPRLSQSSSSGRWDLNPPLAVTVDRLHVDKLALGAPVLGAPMTLSLAGKGSVGGGAAAADLMLHRIDQTPGKADLHFAYGGEPPHLRLAADIVEPTGQVLSSLLGRPEPLPLVVKIAGKGPLADWHGNLAAKVDDEASLATNVRITGATGGNQTGNQGSGQAGSQGAAGGYHLTLNGAGQIEKLLPPQFRPLLGAKPNFTAEIDFGPGRTVVVDSVKVEAAFGTLTGHGRLDRQTGMLSGEATIDSPDLSRLEPLLGIPVSGAGKAHITVSGTTANPNVRVSFTVTDLGVSGNKIQTARGEIGIEGKGPLTDAATPLAINGSGRLEGIKPASGPLPGHLGQALDWEAVAHVDRKAQHVALDEITLKDASGATIRANATADGGSITGQAQLHVPDVQPFAAGALHGALALTADFKGATGGTGTAVLNGKLDGFASGRAVLDAALGRTINIAGTVRRLADGTLAAQDVTATGAEVTLAAQGRRSPDGRLALDYRLDAPRLAALDPRLTGQGTLSGTLGGSPGALAAEATFQSPGLSAAGVRFDRLRAHLALAPLDKPAGPLDIAFRAGKLEGRATADIALQPGEALRISNLRLQGAGADLAGNLAIGLAETTVDGRLAGTIPELRPWSDLVGRAVDGSVRLDAALTPKDGQSLDLTLDGQRLAYGALGTTTARALRVTAHLTDLLHRPQGRAALQLTGVKAGTAVIDAARLEAATTEPGRFDIAGRMKGRYDQPMALTVAADAALAPGTVALHLTQLAGTFAGARLALEKPLTVAARGGDLSFADLALRFGNGRLAGAGALKGKALSLHLLAEDLPVQPLAKLGGQEGVSGVLGFEVDVAGTRARPEGHFVLDGEQLRFAAASRPDLAPLGIVASADWQADRLRFKGRIAGPQGAALGFSGAAPLLLAPQGFAVRVPPDGALAFRLEGDGELANLADLLPLREDRLAGKFDVDITVGGTVATPVANGRLTVTDGRYESLAAGTVLTGVHFALVGDRERLVLRDFAATDGTGGRLDVTGAVDLAATPGPAVDVAARLTGFRAIRRDEATAQVSGDIRITGTVAAPLVTTALRVDNADLRVPEKLPKKAQPIPVTSINSATGQVLSTPEQQAGASALAAVRLAVEADAPGQIFVRGRGLDSEWRGRLSITGTTAAPQLTGKLEVVRGTYSVLGKTFTLTRGTITFLGGNRIDPQIDFEARSSSSDIVAVAHITGTVSDPKLQFTSEPALPQDEILAHLLFGSSLRQISPAQGLQLAQAAAALASGGGPGVLDQIRQGLGLDRLTIGSAATNPLLSGPDVPGLSSTGLSSGGLPGGGLPGGAGSPLGNTAVSAGKYVANGVYVGVTQGLGAGSSTVTVEINVTPHITVNTEAGQQSGTGLGVNWKLDY